METQQSTSRNTDWESMAVAIVLLATGLILVGGDFFGILSLDRVRNLWPAALIMIGLVDLLCQAGEPRGAVPAVADKQTHAGQLR